MPEEPRIRDDLIIGTIRRLRPPTAIRPLRVRRAFGASDGGGRSQTLLRRVSAYEKSTCFMQA